MRSAPTALFSSHVLQVGQSCKKTGKRCTEPNPVSPVWSTLSLEKHLQFPWGLCGRYRSADSNMSSKAAKVWLEAPFQGDVSSHCSPCLPEHSTNKIFGSSRSSAVLCHYIHPTAPEKPSGKEASYGKNRVI